MALTAVDPADLPNRSAGKTSLDADEQAALVGMLQNGQAASDGASYATSKEAARAQGPYLRFARAQVKEGNLAGSVIGRTFVTKRDKDDKPTAFGWAVALR